jgi:hypothetical protein
LPRFLSRRYNLRLRFLVMFLIALALSWGTQDAQAGAIRFAGKKLAKGTTTVASTTAGGVASAGKATGGAVATGAGGFAKGVKATPGVLARGTKAAAKGIAKAIW